VGGGWVFKILKFLRNNKKALLNLTAGLSLPVGMVSMQIGTASCNFFIFLKTKKPC
jgi:hypothetical protein